MEDLGLDFTVDDETFGQVCMSNVQVGAWCLAICSGCLLGCLAQHALRQPCKCACVTATSCCAASDCCQDGPLSQQASTQLLCFTAGA